jgi:hypothetical protein
MTAMSCSEARFTPSKLTRGLTRLKALSLSRRLKTIRQKTNQGQLIPCDTNRKPAPFRLLDKIFGDIG